MIIRAIFLSVATSFLIKLKFQRICLTICAVAVLTLVATNVAFAQADPSERLRAALKETTIQLRSAQDEIGRLRAENEQLKAQPMNLAPKSVAPAAPNLEAKIQHQAGELSALRQQLEVSKAEQAAAAQALIQARQSLAAVEKSAQSEKGNAEHLKAEFDVLSNRANRCADDNASLVGISQSLLDRYRDKGVWSALRDQEALIGIHRIELENLAQQYHAQIKDCSLAQNQVEQPSPSQVQKKP